MRLSTVQEDLDGQEMISPSREHDRLGTMRRLPGNASNVWEVCAPLPAVEPVLPPLPHAHTLHRIAHSKGAGHNNARDYPTSGSFVSEDEETSFKLKGKKTAAC
jgi:hypothetical protein